jgi:hypothetical protein
MFVAHNTFSKIAQQTRMKICAIAQAQKEESADGPNEKENPLDAHYSR